MCQSSGIEPFVSQAKNLAEKMFNLEIAIEIDAAIEDFSAGHYDFERDRVCLHQKFIETLNRRHPDTDLKKIVEHTVCHEFGHACEARQFAEEGVFPYVVKISNVSIIVIDSTPLKTNSLKDEMNYFVNSVFDYSIDKKLYEVKLYDQTAKFRVGGIRDSQCKKIENEKERFRRKVEILFNLPTYVHDYEFGDIKNLDRKTIEQYVVKNVGEKVWQKSSSLLAELSLVDVRKLRTNMSALLERVLSLKTSWRLDTKESVCTHLPSFWDKEKYYLIYID